MKHLFSDRIQVNDQIIEVDGVSLVGVTQIFAAQTLKNTSGLVRYEGCEIFPVTNGSCCHRDDYQ